MTFFCAHQHSADTESPSPIQTEQPYCERSPDPQEPVSSFRLGHCDDAAFADRLQRAWQKMLDEDYFGAMGQQDRERTA
jgi:hypothetical protein